MGNTSVTKGVELAKSKGGTHFSVSDEKKGKSLNEKDVTQILRKILKELPRVNRITVTSCSLCVLPNQELENVASLITLSLEDNHLSRLPGDFLFFITFF